MHNILIMMVVGMLLFGIFLIVMGASKSPSRRPPRRHTSNTPGVYVDLDFDDDDDDDRGWFGNDNDRSDFGGSSDDGGGDSD